MKKYIDDGRVHEGHRSRMKAKLIAHGQRIFDTYELLEMLLYQVIPLRDTNPIAKNLLYVFGGLDGVLRARREDLTEVCGIGERAADFLTTVGYLSDLIGAEIVDEDDLCFSDYESVGRFLAEYFSGVEERQVVAIFLDSSMRLISMKKMYDLDFESGGVKAKPFIDEAMKNHAVVVITAHNHPYGPFYPTQGDRATNTLITDALNMTNIVHAEHYIISGGYFAGLGSLKSFAVKLSQMPKVSDFIETRTRYEGKLHRVDIPDDSTKSAVIAEAGRNEKDREYFARLLSFHCGDRASATADVLLKKYRTVENSFCAPVSEISSITSEGVAVYLKLLAYVTSRRVTDRIRFGIRQSSATIAEYLKALFLGESVEKTYLIAFDGDGRLVGIELLGEGTVNASEVMPRKAVEIAMQFSASAVSIAHNHPFGTPEPSADDIKITEEFSALFNACEIDFKDHYIVAGQLCDTVF